MRLLVLLATILGLACACEDEPATAPSPTPDTAPTLEAAPDPEAEPAERRPRSKRVQPTAAERLGSLPDRIGVAVGEPAPDATVQDAEGQPVQLRDLVEDGPVMLVFYRGGWCPFCNYQIHQLTEAYPQYRERGVIPVAISVDRPDESAKTQATYEIPFPVLSDTDLAAHRAYRVMHEVDEAERERLQGFGMDIEQASGRDHHVIAIPSVFVIDAEGIVRWAHADPDYRTRPSNEQILAVIDALSLSPAE